MGGHYAEAAQCYQAALWLRPDDADAHNNLGAALADLGRLEEAVACYKEAIRLRPGFVNAHYNLGNALRLSNRLEESVVSYQEALWLRPDFAEGFTTGQRPPAPGAASGSDRVPSKGRAARAKFALAHNNLGLGWPTRAAYPTPWPAMARLRLDPNFAERTEPIAGLAPARRPGYGWPEYDWRWRCSDFSIPKFHQPAWDGSPLNGGTVLLYTEQGMGDTLLFVRFVPQIKEGGGRVVLAAPEPLHPILSRCTGIDRLIPRNGTLPEFDVHCPLMSLPRVLGTTWRRSPLRSPTSTPTPIGSSDGVES